MRFIIATLIVFVIIASVLAQDFSVFSWTYWQDGGTTSRSEVVRNLGLLAAGIIGLGFGIWRAVTAHLQTQAAQGQASAATEQARVANEQARIAQQGQFTERFSRAAEHLGSGQLPVRLGGIYALWRLAQDSPERDVVPVIDILCAFVRDPPPAEPPQTGPSTTTADAAQPGREPSDAAAKLRPDVQTVLNLIGNENADYRALLPAGYRLDLTGANLRHAQLMGADLPGTRLIYANLNNADLTGANLTNANLASANLTNANLMDADLTEVHLFQANLTGATLLGVNLTGANLWEPNLTNANLRSANLTGASLVHAHLTNTDLKNADLSDADLTGADLTDAKNLTQQQLGAVRYEPGRPPKLPPGLVLPEPPPEPEAKSATPPPEV